jgi:Domain of unknown function (DUF4347)
MGLAAVTGGATASKATGEELNMPNVVIIFDSNHDETTKIAQNRAQEIGATAIGASDVPDLQTKLGQMLKSGTRIKQLYFMTHGNPGAIMFGTSTLIASRVRTELTGLGNLFLPNAEIGFDGCNVAEVKTGCEVGETCAETDNGPVFLSAVAKTLLPQSGGHVYGWTSAGWGFPSFGGSVIHHWNGTAVHIYITKRGQTRLAVGRASWPEPLGRWEVKVDKEVFYYLFETGGRVGWTDRSRYHAGIWEPIEKGTWKMDIDGVKIAWKGGETEIWDVPLYDEYQTGTAMDLLGFDLSVVARMVPLNF